MPDHQTHLAPSRGLYMHLLTHNLFGPELLADIFMNNYELCRGVKTAFLRIIVDHISKLSKSHRKRHRRNSTTNAAATRYMAKLQAAQRSPSQVASDGASDDAGSSPGPDDGHHEAPSWQHTLVPSLLAPLEAVLRVTRPDGDKYALRSVAVAVAACVRDCGCAWLWLWLCVAVAVAMVCGLWCLLVTVLTLRCTCLDWWQTHHRKPGQSAAATARAPGRHAALHRFGHGYGSPHRHVRRPCGQGEVEDGVSGSTKGGTAASSGGVPCHRGRRRRSHLAIEDKVQAHQQPSVHAILFHGCTYSFVALVARRCWVLMHPGLCALQHHKNFDIATMSSHSLHKIPSMYSAPPDTASIFDSPGTDPVAQDLRDEFEPNDLLYYYHLLRLLCKCAGGHNSHTESTMQCVTRAV